MKMVVVDYLNYPLDHMIDNYAILLPGDHENICHPDVYTDLILCTDITYYKGDICYLVT